MNWLSVTCPLHMLDAEVYASRRAGAGMARAAHRLDVTTMRMNMVAGSDPELTSFCRELRWALYNALKGLALNNLLAGRRGAALRLALAACRNNPREIRDLARFRRLLAGDAAAGEDGGRYSRAECVMLEEAL